jgi:uncharacterized Tic20 family protein
VLLLSSWSCQICLGEDISYHTIYGTVYIYYLIQETASSCRPSRTSRIWVCRFYFNIGRSLSVATDISHGNILEPLLIWFVRAMLDTLCDVVSHVSLCFFILDARIMTVVFVTGKTGKVNYSVKMKSILCLCKVLSAIWITALLLKYLIIEYILTNIACSPKKVTWPYCCFHIFEWLEPALY